MTSKCIDHIYTSIPDLHLISDVARISISDHYLIYTCLDVDMPKVKHKILRFRNYKTFDENSFLADLSENNITDNIFVENENADINIMWNKWKTAFLDICQKHAPLKTCRIKERYSPWITEDIIKLIYKRDYFKRKYDQNKLREYFIEYRKIRNSITSLIRKSKQKYFNEVSNKYKNNPKKMWNEFSMIIGNKNKDDVPTEIDSEMMNNYFTNVGKEMNKSYAHGNIEWKPTCRFSLV